ncbi:hypothetical protein Cgig2_027416 [Carnegiea gigantea]|uniref:Cation/H+ exchanger domain-containing protein n=1 Tax=Carnegiea gigantea TaxID=171969 RepID=A0A9Q1JLL8_9CARY|nr:hypothetical protein Cgig2_027416 [Carnegiea gigantea]
MLETPSSLENADPITCYVPAMFTTNGMWQGDNPLDYALPLFVLQLMLVLVTTLVLIFILKPLRQPCVFAEILVGFIVGPSILGTVKKLSTTLFPLRSVIVLETMAYVGIQYFVFLVGVEIDLSVIKRGAKKAISIASGKGKRVSFIILPFHKHQIVDKGMESLSPVFQTINQNILDKAPCSVGILVDRGLNGSFTPCSVGILVDRGLNGSFTRSDINQVSHYVVMLFLGGPNDREALAYAWRMSHHLSNSITIMRFLPGPNVPRPNCMVYPTDELDKPELPTVMNDTEHERRLDEEYLNEFRAKMAGSKSIAYVEKIVNNGDEIVTTIRSIGSVQDLYIVRRGQGAISPLTIGLADWCECLELGAIGDLIASVLVVQHVGLGDPSMNQVSNLMGPVSPIANNSGQVDFDEQVSLEGG